MMAEKKKYLLRLDESLFEALERWAADDLRSVNSEIEFLLREALRKAGRLRREEEKPPGGSNAGPRDGAGPAGGAGQ
jgi:hypothetical protein